MGANENPSCVPPKYKSQLVGFTAREARAEEQRLEAVTPIEPAVLPNCTKIELEVRELVIQETVAPAGNVHAKELAVPLERDTE